MLGFPFLLKEGDKKESLKEEVRMKPYESHESEENYLEAILMLSLDHRKVRAIDIANMLGFSKPSVSIALKRLKEEGKVESDEKGSLTLTEHGLVIAKNTYEKHTVLTDVLVALGVNAYTASQDACRMEHVLSPESFAKIKDFYAKYKEGAFTKK